MSQPTTVGQAANSVLQRVRLQQGIRELAEQHLTPLECQSLTPHQMAHRLAEKLVELGERYGPAEG